MQKDGKHVVINDFNLYCPDWRGIHILIMDRNSEGLLSIVEEYGLQFFHKKGIIIYKETKY